MRPRPWGVRGLMDSMSQEALDARVHQLERHNRVLAFVSAMLIVAVAYVGTNRPRTVRAEAFELASADGSVRAELTLRDDEPGLYLRDRQGVDRVAVFHASDGSGLHVIDSSGTTRIGVVQFAHGGGGVALHGPDSRGAAVLYLKGDGSLRFFDASGAVTREVLSTGK